MASKNTNPYRAKTLYNAIFAFLKKHQVATRTQLLEVAKKLGKSDEAAEAAVTVVLSPRAASKRGDCRGNMSAQGHIYYVQPLAKKGKEERKYRLRWRTTALEPRKREVKVEVKAEKKVKAPKVKAPKPKTLKVEQIATATAPAAA